MVTSTTVNILVIQERTSSFSELRKNIEDGDGPVGFMIDQNFTTSLRERYIYG